jgi:two-component system sensor histidine kinase DegS
MPRPAQEVANLTEQLLQELTADLEQSSKELKEIDINIRQSNDEVAKLTQRNAQLTNKLRQMEMNLDTFPRKDIREIYTTAGDAQMRLFMMRIQLEKLQARQQSLEQLQATQRKVLEALGRGAQAAGRGPTGQDMSASLIARVIEAQESERQRLARQMHDGPAQSLTNLILQAEICERSFDGDPKRTREELGGLKSAVKGTFQKVREFIFDLRPMMLDDLGVLPTLRRYVQEFREKNGVAANFTLTGKERRLPAPVEVTIFRAVQTLLKNVQEHAHASKVDVAVALEDDSVSVVVEDDGSGFNVDEALTTAAEQHAIGLTAMRNQIELLGGHVQIESAAGRGTRAAFDLPLT